MRGPNRARRAFLRQIGSVGISAWAAGRCAYSVYAQNPPDVPPVVVVVRMPGLSEATGDAQRSAYARLLDVALARLGLNWARVAQPADVVGIKVNCLGGPLMSTSPQLAAAVADGVLRAGVSPDRVIVFDREDRELIAAGYEISKDPARVQVYGTDSSPAGYEEKLTQARSVSTRLSTIVTEQCTRLISLPIAKDHMIAGVTGAMKNYFGCIASPNKYHADVCDPYVADLFSHRVFRSRHALAVCDAATLLYEGGPHDSPDHHYAYDGIIAGLDPVATDRVIWAIIEGVRAEKGLGPLIDDGRSPTYLASASALGLGCCDFESIQVVQEELPGR
ncbi:MAG TPA: DUF362 domain-containing protein [Armatimonadota bacterium]|nr:DUF362 domain-containing protein [Armatimonadota bacterium]